MNNLNSILLLYLILLSCTNCSYQSDNSKNETTVNESSSISEQLNTRLKETYYKAIIKFPNDSTSLHRFYFTWFKTDDSTKLSRQIERLENLMSDKSVSRYKTVEKNLKPLLKRIIHTNSINVFQADSLVYLYSEYDYFQGESLLSQLLNEEDNYKLVWESFKILSNETKRDTVFIASLIELNKNVKTNVELAQAMESFIIEAIQNNPYGFLDMYSTRQESNRKDFSQYISLNDNPDKNLIDIYNDISSNSTDSGYRYLASDLLNKINN